ncbi:hCG41307, isoform CRA_a [Homo sapiens]
MDSRFPDFQDLDLEPERACHDAAGTLEVDFFLFLNFGTVDLAVRKETTTEQALPPALLLGIRRPEFLSRPSVQTEDAPSKVNYVLCLLIAECSPGPSDYLPCAIPSAYRPGTWIFARDDSYHLTTDEDTHSSGPL